MLLLYLDTVTSLQCYECPNGYCSSDTNLGSVRQCSSVVSPVCYKIVTDTAGPGSVVRMCGSYDYGQGRNTCKDTTVELQGGVSIVATICTCDSHLCNGGSGLLIQRWIFFICILYCIAANKKWSG